MVENGGEGMIVITSRLPLRVGQRTTFSAPTIGVFHQPAMVVREVTYSEYRGCIEAHQLDLQPHETEAQAATEGRKFYEVTTD